METEELVQEPSLDLAVLLAPYLASDVLDELMDPRFRNQLHGRSRTYSAGCRGLLCRKAVRERAAKKCGSVYLLPRHRDEELEAVQNWHEYVRSCFRKPYTRRESVAV